MGSDLLMADSNLFEESISKANDFSAIKRREQKEDERIIRRFRVITVEEVTAILDSKTLPPRQ